MNKKEYIIHSEKTQKSKKFIKVMKKEKDQYLKMKKQIMADMKQQMKTQQITEL